MTSYTQYNNKTGHRYLAGAVAGKSQAGILEIWTADSRYTMYLDDNDRLLLCDLDGFADCRLRLSSRDIERFKAIAEQINT